MCLDEAFLCTPATYEWVADLDYKIIDTKNTYFVSPRKTKCAGFPKAYQKNTSRRNLILQSKMSNDDIIITLSCKCNSWETCTLIWEDREEKHTKRKQKVLKMMKLQTLFARNAYWKFLFAKEIWPALHWSLHLMVKNCLGSRQIPLVKLQTKFSQKDFENSQQTPIFTIIWRKKMSKKKLTSCRTLVILIWCVSLLV